MAKYGTFKYGTAKYNGDILWLFYRTVDDILNDTERNYINYTDLNRIESRMLELTQQLNKYKYENHIITKTNWEKQASTNEITNFPMNSHLIRIKENLKTLMDSYYVYYITPQAPNTLENLNIYKINDIENILYHLHLIIKNMKKDFKISGICLCGGVDI